MTQAGVGTNRYAYAGNDPVNLSDPGGNNFWGDVKESWNDMVDATGDALNGRVDKSDWGDPNNGQSGIARINGNSIACYGCSGVYSYESGKLTQLGFMAVSSKSVTIGSNSAIPKIKNVPKQNTKLRGFGLWSALVKILVERWSRKFGPVVKMNRPMRRTIRNDEENPIFG